MRCELSGDVVIVKLSGRLDSGSAPAAEGDFARVLGGGTLHLAIDMSKLDYISITHNHQDHYNLETLLQLRHKTGKLILPVNNGGTLPDPSMKLIARPSQ